MEWTDDIAPEDDPMDDIEQILDAFTSSKKKSDTVDRTKMFAPLITALQVMAIPLLLLS